MSEIVRDDGFTPVLKYKRNKKGETVIPASVRPDGSVRKEKKIKEGYLPPEEQPVYNAKKSLENKGYQTCPGFDFIKEKKTKKKKKEKKIEETPQQEQQLLNETTTITDKVESVANVEVANQKDSNVKHKKNLRKKIFECEKLSQMKSEGKTLDSQQLTKLARLDDLKRELEALN